MNSLDAPQGVPLAARRYKLAAIALPAAFAVSAVYALSVYVPLVQPNSVDLHLDWLLALNVARAKGLTFGRDIQFTYGPLGFAWIGYFPGQFASLVLIWTAVAALLWFALLLGARRLKAPLPIALAGLFGIFFLAAGEDSSLLDSRLLLLTIFLLGYHFCIDDRPMNCGKSLLICAISLASLMKFTYLVAGALACGAISLDEFIRTRKPVTLPLLAGLFAIGWRLSGQAFAALPAYFSASINVASGYSEAMALWSASELSDLLAFAVPALILVALVYTASDAMKKWRRFLHAGALLVLLWLVLKSGFVRHDHHEIIATGALPPAIGFYALVNFRKIKVDAWSAAWIVCLVLALFAANSSYSRYAGENLLQRSFESFAQTFAEIGETFRDLRGKKPAVAKEYDALVAKTAQDWPLPNVDGTVDVFESSLRRAVFNGLDYQPRPALQSYAAYTPRLAEADAAFLRGDRAPDNLFFRSEAADQRLLAMEDGRAWLEILSRYDLVDQAGAYLQFRRAAVPRTYTLEPISQTHGTLGVPLRIPRAPGELIWAVIELKTNTFGAILSALYKPPPLVIQVQLADDRQIAARFIPGCGRSGFLLSPLINGNRGFAALFNREARPLLSSSEVVQFRIDGTQIADPTLAYQPRFEVKLFRVNFSAPSSN